VEDATDGPTDDDAATNALAINSSDLCFVRSAREPYGYFFINVGTLKWKT
jgi:hypothetical protein